MTEINEPYQVENWDLANETVEADTPEGTLDLVLDRRFFSEVGHAYVLSNMDIVLVGLNGRIDVLRPLHENLLKAVSIRLLLYKK